MRQSETEKGGLLGERLLGAAPETASIIIEELTKRFGIGLKEPTSAKWFLIETFVFYMHLIDRLAFRHFGAAKREIFAESLIAAVMSGVSGGLNKDLSAVDLVAEMRDTYNRRQLEYSEYRVLIPAKDAPLKGMLFWEFSKVLFALLNDDNPATLIFLNVVVTDHTEMVLTKAMKVEEVLKS